MDYQRPCKTEILPILVRAIEGEAIVSDVNALHEAVENNKADEGWLVAIRRIMQGVCDSFVKKPDKCSVLFIVYTFDELLDEKANFEGYLNWLEAEIKRRGIDTMYVPLACSKDDFDSKHHEDRRKVFMMRTMVGLMVILVIAG